MKKNPNMKKTILFLIVSIFISINVVSAQVDDDDTQFWHETTLEIPFNKKTSGIIIGDLRTTDNISDLSDRRIGFALKYKFHKNLEIKPSYVFRVQPRTGPNRYEHRLRLDITPKKKWKKFSLENRSRFEQRIKTAGRTDNTFYRNRTKIKVPVKNSDGDTSFTPFASNDTYFDLRKTRVHRNDIVGGISKKIQKHLTTVFFYQYRRNFQSSTKHIHIIGVNLKFKID